MKCISCGAIITSDQKKCPYCGAKNPEYERKALKIKSLEKEHEEAKEQSKKTFKTIWQDKLCNIFLVAAIVLFVCIIGAMIVGNTLGEVLKVFKPSLGKAEYTKQMEEYYGAGDYDLLYKYMSDNELFEKEEFYKYSQAAHMNHTMNEFRVAAYPYIQYAKGEKTKIERSTSAANVVSSAHFMYDWRFAEGETAYLNNVEMDPSNVEMYNEYLDEIRYIFTTYFKLTDEELEDFFYGSGFYVSDYDEVIKERTGYFEY